MNRRDREPARSWYEATRRYRIDAGRIDGELQADVVVIGGGLTGASAALCLAERGVRVALLESRFFGWGASGRSGGQIIAGYSCDQRVLEKLAGLDTARELWEHSLAALDYTRERVRRHGIDCDLRSGYLHVGVKQRHARELAEWAEHLERVYGYPALVYHDGGALRARLQSNLYQAGVSDFQSGHLHPLNYTLGMVKAAGDAGAALYEDATVNRVVDGSGGASVVETDGGHIRCDCVVYACNAYLDRLHPGLRRLIMPVGTYIIATEPLGERVAGELIPGGAAVADTNFVLDYYRLSADTRLLFGGRVSYSTLEPIRLRESLERRMLRVFPQLAGTGVEFTWGGFVAITRNRAPHIGRLPGNAYHAQGYSGQGMALAGYAGSLLADAVMGERDGLACFGRIPHKAFPGGPMMRKPALVAAMAYHRLLDKL
ncbi:MAG: FAD-binding oxidoreductase [Gammaproteobacteria bacterium]|nr:FAD-binding oxidoreductase [Gammaproteobacteria bacterium]